MQALVKILTVLSITMIFYLPASYAAGRIGPGPAAEQSQHEGSALFAAANPGFQAATMQTNQQALTDSKTSLHKHTKTHPAAIILLVMAIAGVFLFPCLVERCKPAWVERFSAV